MDYYFNNENKYQTTINLSGTNLEAGFDTFGFGFVGNKLPLIFELRPLPIIETYSPNLDMKLLQMQLKKDSI